MGQGYCGPKVQTSYSGRYLSYIRWWLSLLRWWFSLLRWWFSLLRWWISRPLNISLLPCTFPFFASQIFLGFLLGGGFLSYTESFSPVPYISPLPCTFLSYASQISLLRKGFLSMVADFSPTLADFSPTLADFSPTLAKFLFSARIYAAEQ